MQQEDGGPWAHGTIERHGLDDHKARGYKIRVTETGCVISRMMGHMKATPISVKDYLWKEMLKANRPQAHDKLSKVIHHFALLNQQNHLNNLKMEAKDKSQNYTSYKTQINRLPGRNKAK